MFLFVQSTISKTRQVAVLKVALRIGALELNQAAFPRNKHTFNIVYSDQVRVFVNEWHHYFKHLSTKFYL